MQLCLWCHNNFFFSTRFRHIVWSIKSRIRFVYIICRQLSFFLNNFVSGYPIKLKIELLYHINSTFRNTDFYISVDVPLTLFRMGWQKEPPTSFSPLPSRNIGISLKNFLTFSFNSFATLVKKFKTIPSASPKLLSLDQDQASKKVVFLVKSLQNWGYDTFSRRNARVTKVWWHGHINNIILVTW